MGLARGARTAASRSRPVRSRVRPPYLRARRAAPLPRLRSWCAHRRCRMSRRTRRSALNGLSRTRPIRRIPTRTRTPNLSPCLSEPSAQSRHDGATHHSRRVLVPALSPTLTPTRAPSRSRLRADRSRRASTLRPFAKTRSLRACARRKKRTRARAQATRCL
jgi:hypothetical protein